MEEAKIKPWKSWQIILLIAVILLFGWFILHPNGALFQLTAQPKQNDLGIIDSKTGTQPQENITPVSTDANVSNKPDDVNFGSNWQYKEDVDQMTDKTDYYAIVESPSILSLKFPYDGGVVPSITIMHQSHHNSVYLSVDKGQFMSNVDGEEIRVKFDDGTPMIFDCSQPSDGSTNTLFIDEANRFISKLKRSKRLMIQALFYDNGKQTMEFGTQGLIWKH